MNQVEIRILGMVSLSFSSEILNPLYGMKQIEWQFSFKSNFFEEDIPNVLYVGARICIIIICCCCCFIVSCQVFSFSSSLVSFVSYQFYTCYIYLHIIYILFVHNLFGQFSSLRNTSEHIMLWVSFFVLWFGHIHLVSVLIHFVLSFSSTFTHTL